MIVSGEAALRVPCRDVASKREGDRVGRLLVDAILKQNKRATATARKNASLILKGRMAVPFVAEGLSAIQVGVPLRAIVLNFGAPVVLINPRVAGHSGHSHAFAERCLGLDGERTSTRWAWVAIASDNLAGEAMFGGPLMTFPGEGPRRAAIAQLHVGLCEGLLPGDSLRESS